MYLDVLSNLLKYNILGIGNSVFRILVLGTIKLPKYSSTSKVIISSKVVYF